MVESVGFNCHALHAIQLEDAWADEIRKQAHVKQEELRQPGGGGFGRPAGPRQPASQPPSQPPLLCTCMFASPPVLSRSQDDVTDPWSVW